MAATRTNDIWIKCERALKRYILSDSIGIDGSNLYCGHENAEKQVPHIVTEAHSGEPETLGRCTGNWLVHCTITITTKLFDETGQDNSGRFASIMDAFMQREAASTLTLASEFFTCFYCQVTGWTKSIQGDVLVVEINLTLTCCGSVIS
jgi:hypothetical protein